MQKRRSILGNGMVQATQGRGGGDAWGEAVRMGGVGLGRSRWARLMLLAGDAPDDRKEKILGYLQARAAYLYSRPYLPHGTVEKTLLLLLALYEVSLNGG